MILINWCVVSLFLLISPAFHHVNAVDRNNFKSCEQSSFCRRCRRMKSGESSYELLLDTVSAQDSTVSAQLINAENNVRFSLVLTALKDSSFRLQIDEVLPLKPRYRVEHVLEKTPVESRLEITEKSSNSVTVTAATGVKAVIFAAPFKVDFYNANNQVAVTANQRGLFRFEHQRTKPVPKAEGVEEEGAAAGGEGELRDDAGEDPGAWEENYKSHHDSKPLGPTAVALDFTFPGAEQVYGVPEHADSLALKSTKKTDPYRLYNLDVFEYELDNPMSLYAAIPFVIAQSVSKTVGLFWLNTAETWVDVAGNSDENVVSSIVNYVSGGTKVAQVETHFMSESGILDVFILLGPKPHDVFKQYAELVGTTFLPPYFSLAYHQCRWNYNDQDDVSTVSENFDNYDIPMDVMWLDIEHTDGKKYFTWDPVKFSKPLEMVKNLTDKGRKLVTIVDVHVKRDGGYFVHNDCENNGYYMKNKDGNVYEGWCWPGSSSYPDVLNPEVRDYYAEQYKFDKYLGSTDDVHIWNDMNEPSVFNGPEVTMPKDLMHYGGWEHRDIHNIYGMLFVMSTYQGMLNRGGVADKALAKRPFILSRSGFAGIQRYAALWTGDNAADWGHLAISLPMCLSLAISGVSFCGADVGGFFKNPDQELLIRWYQAGAFLPFFRAHAHIDTKRREPWLFGPEATSLIREAIRKRYMMLPFWYTQFYINNQTGLPVIRPLWAEFPADRNTFTIDNEFLIGDSILVRPVTEQGATEVKVYLPGQSEVWYDMDTYQPFQANGYINLPVGIRKTPVFVRAGSIIPLKLRVRRSSALMHNDPFTFVVVLKENGTAHGNLYIDDGSTFQFLYKKKSLFISLAFENLELSSKFIHKGHHYDTKSKVERVVIVNAPPSITRARATRLKAGQVTDLETSYDSNNILTIRKPDLLMSEEWKITLH
uniref:Glucosidase II subunit alpha n=1 Tax=Nilaparvata lugens TaxID=108931 RepID=A0A2K8FTL6_NILLU|nr:aNeutral alpha-glucosidase AB [Nilaparvata lugens]